MTQPGSKPKAPRRGTKRPAHGGADWAAGLKQLYDSVVEEPIPDAFKDLLSKLDDA